MRIQDNRLARHLLETRNHMNILKLTQSCDKHAEMLDDVAYELEEEDMLTGLIKGSLYVNSTTLTSSRPVFNR